MELISIIVPVFNSEETLPRCIESILHQEYEYFELVLIDDGSNDSSGRICDNYTVDARVKVLHKKNGGVSSARNVGLSIASGRWITFCDSDDYVYPDWLTSFATHFQRAPAIIVQNAIFEREEGKCIYAYDCGMTSMETTISRFTGSRSHNEVSFQGYLWNKCFRKNIIDNGHVSFNEDIFVYEDEAFILNYCGTADSQIVIYSNHVGYHYYMPSISWGKKYGASFSAVLYVFCIAKKYNLSQELFLERVLWSLLHYWKTDKSQYHRYLSYAIPAIGKDILMLAGKKRLLLWPLAFTESSLIWRLLLDSYFCIIKNNPVL